MDVEILKKKMISVQELNYTCSKLTDYKSYLPILDVKNKYKAEIERNENEINILDNGHSRLWLQCISYRSTTLIDIPELIARVLKSFRFLQILFCDNFLRIGTLKFGTFKYNRQTSIVMIF